MQSYSITLANYSTPPPKCLTLHPHTIATLSQANKYKASLVSIAIRGYHLEITETTASRPAASPRAKKESRSTSVYKSLCENDVECRITTDQYTCIGLAREYLECRGFLSSAACFVTYRRLPAYKKPNGGGSNLPPYNPRGNPSPPDSSSSRPLSRPPSSHPLPPPYARRPASLRGRSLQNAHPPPCPARRYAGNTVGTRRGARDRITPLSVLTPKTRNWGTM